MIDISKLNKAQVLAVLYNNSRPLGLGIMQYEQKRMTEAEAAELLSKQDGYFDYVKGRVMKVDLSGDTLDPWGYDRDNGQGAAAAAIASLKEA
jgi:hypothetical protein